MKEIPRFTRLCSIRETIETCKVSSRSIKFDECHCSDHSKPTDSSHSVKCKCCIESESQTQPYLLNFAGIYQSLTHKNTPSWYVQMRSWVTQIRKLQLEKLMTPDMPSCWSPAPEKYSPFWFCNALNEFLMLLYGLGVYHYCAFGIHSCSFTISL